MSQFEFPTRLRVLETVFIETREIEYDAGAKCSPRSIRLNVWGRTVRRAPIWDERVNATSVGAMENKLTRERQ
jgi:hypothetical protein